MALLGIGDDSVVVAYDDAGGSVAARLWWMLTVTGHPAAVLDGGISAWTGELSIDLAPRPGQVRFTPEPWPLEEVADAIAIDTYRRSGEVIVIDARSAERFRGDPNPVDKRPGHIPGAASAPWSGNIDPATGRFRTPEALRDRFEKAGVRADRPTVCYCGSGVTACHNLLALNTAGFGNTRLYPGSWSDWSADPDRPVATGS